MAGPNPLLTEFGIHHILKSGSEVSNVWLNVIYRGYQIGPEVFRETPENIHKQHSVSTSRLSRHEMRGR